MDFTPQQIRNIVVGVFILLVSVALHEFGHAIAAYKLGDDTPKRQGRVTLNPLAHADPVGTLLLPVASAIYSAASGVSAGFGWGKPVQWNPSRIRRGIKMATANIIVSFAGPFMNLVLATVVALVHVILLKTEVISTGTFAEPGAVHLVLSIAVITNFILFFFNLLPIPPLDGGHILEAFMPYRHREKFEAYARYSPFVLLGVMMIPQVRVIFSAPATWCATSLYKGLGALFGVVI